MGGPSPSVLAFFRPGYVPPNSAIASRALNAPEFQITTESSVAGYVNFMQKNIASGIAGLKADTSALLPLVADSAALLSEVNVLLAAGQLSAATLANLRTALDSINVSSAAGQANRIHAAITLVLAAPEYITQKQVGVGMPVTQHPLHRSVRAALPHTAPALRRDDQTLVRVRVADE